MAGKPKLRDAAERMFEVLISVETDKLDPATAEWVEVRDPACEACGSQMSAAGSFRRREADEEFKMETENRNTVSRPNLLVDFDGVIHSYTSGWRGIGVIPDPPVPGALEFLVEALDHFAVSIYSSRSQKREGIAAMESWLWTAFREEFPDWTAEAREEVIRSINFPTEKPAAFLTIDDRAICFRGKFPDAKSLLDFRPWNRPMTDAEEG